MLLVSIISSLTLLPVSHTVTQLLEEIQLIPHVQLEKDISYEVYVYALDTVTLTSEILPKLNTSIATCIARNAYFEARGEGITGMHAVTNVVLNRSTEKAVDPCEVIYKPSQFSWTIDSKTASIDDPKTYAEAEAIAQKAIKGQLKDITGGATFYYNPKLVAPYWAKSMQHTTTVGQHRYVKPKSKQHDQTKPLHDRHSTK